MAKHYDSNSTLPAEKIDGREQYLRDNAVAIVAQKDLKIARLREQVAKLHRRCEELRRQNRAMRETLRRPRK
jgi:hypothetical protein